MIIKQVNSEADIKKLVGLFIAAFAEPPYFEKWSRKDAHKHLLEFWQCAKGFCIYAEDKGEAVGLLFCRQQTGDDGLHLLIEDTAVSPRLRGRGIGGMLVKEIEAIAREKKAKAIKLLANTTCPAVHFWEKQGYQQDNYVELKKRM